MDAVTRLTGSRPFAQRTNTATSTSDARTAVVAGGKVATMTSAYSRHSVSLSMPGSSSSRPRPASSSVPPLFTSHSDAHDMLRLSISPTTATGEHDRPELLAMASSPDAGATVATAFGEETLRLDETHRASNNLSQITRVVVAVRVRPLSDLEERSGAVSIVGTEGERISLVDPVSLEVGALCSAQMTALQLPKRTFAFDYVYGNAKQEQIFKDLGLRVLDHAFAGYNSSVFAYGQTGSGKSYTMLGSSAVLDPHSPSVGLIPRICRHLFRRIERRKRDANSSNKYKLVYKLTASYLEIYCEKIRDLFAPPEAVPTPSGAGKGVLGLNPPANAPNNTLTALKVREHPTHGVYVPGLKEVEVSCYADIEKLLIAGSYSRTVAETRLNESSSRSHAVFTLNLTEIQLETTTNTPIAALKSKIVMVDLAGSERADSLVHTAKCASHPSGAAGSGEVLSDEKIAKDFKDFTQFGKDFVKDPSQAAKARSQEAAQRHKEMTKINTSLSALGSVIKALSTHSITHSGSVSVAANFVPYRNSVLTWLLKDSLGGNSATTMIAAVSPADISYTETLSTLKYCESVKHIITHAAKNVEPPASAADREAAMKAQALLIEKLSAEVATLQSQLQAKAQKGAIGSPAAPLGSPAGWGASRMPTSPSSPSENVLDAGAALERAGHDHDVERVFAHSMRRVRRSGDVAATQETPEKILDEASAAMHRYGLRSSPQDSPAARRADAAIPDPSLRRQLQLPPTTHSGYYRKLSTDTWCLVALSKHGFLHGRVGIRLPRGTSLVNVTSGGLDRLKWDVVRESDTTSLSGSAVARLSLDAESIELDILSSKCNVFVNGTLHRQFRAPCHKLRASDLVCFVQGGDFGMFELVCVAAGVVTLQDTDSSVISFGACVATRDWLEAANQIIFSPEHNLSLLLKGNEGEGDCMMVADLESHAAERRALHKEYADAALCWQRRGSEDAVTVAQLSSELQQERASLAQETERAAGLHQQLEAVRHERDSVVSSLEEQLGEARLTVSRLTEQVNMEKAAHLASVQDANVVQIGLEEHCRVLEEQLSNQHAENAALTSDVQQLKAVRADLEQAQQHQTSEHMLELQQLNQAVKGLHDQLGLAATERDAMQAQNAQHMASIMALQQQNSDLSHALELSAAQLKEQERDQQALQNCCDDLRQKLQQLQTENSELGGTLTDLNGRLGMCEQEKASALSRILDLEPLFEACQGESVARQQHIDQQAAELVSLQNMYAELQAQHEQASVRHAAEFTALQKKYAELQAQHEQAIVGQASEVASLHNKCADLQAQHEQADKRQASELASLQHDYADLQARHEQMTVQHSADFAVLQKRYAELQSQHNMILLETAENESARQRSIVALTSDASRLQGEKAALLEEIACERARNEKLQTVMSESSQQLGAAQARITTLDARVAELHGDVGQQMALAEQRLQAALVQEAELNVARGEVESLRSQFLDMVHQKEEWYTRAIKMQEELETTRAAAAHADITSKNLTEELTALTSARDGLAEKNQELSEEIVALQHARSVAESRAEEARADVRRLQQLQLEGVGECDTLRTQFQHVVALISETLHGDTLSDVGLVRKIDGLEHKLHKLEQLVRPTVRTSKLARQQSFATIRSLSQQKEDATIAIRAWIEQLRSRVDLPRSTAASDIALFNEMTQRLLVAYDRKGEDASYWQREAMSGKAKCDEAEETIAMLREQLHSASRHELASIERINKLRHALEGANNALCAVKQASQEKLDAITSQVQNAISPVLVALHAEVASLHAQLEGANTSFAAALQDAERIFAMNIAAFTAQLSQVDADRSAWRLKYERLQSQWASNATKGVDTAKQIEQLTREKTLLEHSLRECKHSAATDMQALQDQLHLLNELATRHKAELDNVNAQLQEQLEDYAIQELRCQQMTEHILQLSQKLESSAAHAADLGTALEGVQAENIELQANVQRMHNALEAAQYEANTTAELTKELMDHHQRTSDSWHARLTASTERVGALEQQLADEPPSQLRQQIVDLQSKVALLQSNALKQEHSSLVLAEKIRRSSKLAPAFSGACGKLRELHAGLKQEAAALLSSCADVTPIRQVTEKLQHLVARQQSLELELVQRDHIAAQLRIMLEQSTNDASDLHMYIDDMKDVIADKDDQLVGVQTELDMLRGLVEEQKQAVHDATELACDGRRQMSRVVELIVVALRDESSLPELSRYLDICKLSDEDGGVSALCELLSNQHRVCREYSESFLSINKAASGILNDCRELLNELSLVYTGGGTHNLAFEQLRADMKRLLDPSGPMSPRPILSFTPKTSAQQQSVAQRAVVYLNGVRGIIKCLQALQTTSISSEEDLRQQLKDAVAINEHNVHLLAKAENEIGSMVTSMTALEEKLSALQIDMLALQADNDGLRSEIIRLNEVPNAEDLQLCEALDTSALVSEMTGWLSQHHLITAVRASLQSFLLRVADRTERTNAAREVQGLSERATHVPAALYHPGSTNGPTLGHPAAITVLEPADTAHTPQDAFPAQERASEAGTPPRPASEPRPSQFSVASSGRYSIASQANSMDLSHMQMTHGGDIHDEDHRMSTPPPPPPSVTPEAPPEPPASTVPEPAGLSLFDDDDPGMAPAQVYERRSSVSSDTGSSLTGNQAHGVIRAVAIPIGFRKRFGTPAERETVAMGRFEVPIEPAATQRSQRRSSVDVPRITAELGAQGARKEVVVSPEPVPLYQRRSSQPVALPSLSLLVSPQTGDLIAFDPLWTEPGSKTSARSDSSQTATAMHTMLTPSTVPSVPVTVEVDLASPPRHPAAPPLGTHPVPPPPLPKPYAKEAETLEHYFDSPRQKGTDNLRHGLARLQSASQLLASRTNMTGIAAAELQKTLAQHDKDKDKR